MIGIGLAVTVWKGTALIITLGNCSAMQGELMGYACVTDWSLIMGSRLSADAVAEYLRIVLTITRVSQPGEGTMQLLGCRNRCTHCQ